ncbi:unnamed protein product [Spirodela intermedia]|uniref:Uncharacterized protein n=1 Tax=Spirodela intermedia TaxID=51605 RepID=A0A7I8LJ34_SPIIN|nr:unnamed protein product [Spirodela intermedia]
MTWVYFPIIQLLHTNLSPAGSTKKDEMCLPASLSAVCLNLFYSASGRDARGRGRACGEADDAGQRRGRADNFVFNSVTVVYIRRCSQGSNENKGSSPGVCLTNGKREFSNTSENLCWTVIHSSSEICSFHVRDPACTKL